MNGWFLGLCGRALVSLVLLFIGCFWAWKCPLKRFRWLFCGYYLFRLVSMFFVVRYKLPSDVSGWYDHALWILSGGVPGINFLTPYNLGFEYLLAGGVWLYPSPFSIVAIFIILEIASLIMLHRSMVCLSDAVTAKRVIILYLLNPITFFSSWCGAQDEPNILLVLSLFIYLSLFTKMKGVYLALLSFVGFAGTKILSLMYFLPLWLSRRWSAVAILFAAVIVYVGCMFGCDINPFCLTFGRTYGDLANGDNIGRMMTTGNIWYLLPAVPKFVEYGLLLLVLAIVGLMFWKSVFDTRDNRVRVKAAIGYLVVSVVAFNIFYSMTFSYYLIPIIPFLIFTFMAFGKKYGKWHFALFLVWSFVVAAKDHLHIGRTLLPLEDATLFINIVAVISVLFNIAILIDTIFLLRGYMEAPRNGVASVLRSMGIGVRP